LRWILRGCYGKSLTTKDTKKHKGKSIAQRRYIQSRAEYAGAVLLEGKSKGTAMPLTHGSSVFLQNTVLSCPERRQKNQLLIPFVFLCALCGSLVLLRVFVVNPRLLSHVKADRRACRHTLSGYWRLAHDNGWRIRSAAVIATAHNIHLAQRETAFNQCNVRVC
jgi:hypothetical protein